MGSPFDFFSPKSWPSDTSVSDQAQKNRALLAAAMIRGGFRPYDREWWHFTLNNEPFPETYFDFYDVLEIERIFVVNPLRVAHCDAGLAEALQPLDDQRPMPLVKRLIAANEQCRRFFLDRTPDAAASSPARPSILGARAPSPAGRIDPVGRTSDWYPRTCQSGCGRARLRPPRLRAGTPRASPG